MGLLRSPVIHGRHESTHLHVGSSSIRRKNTTPRGSVSPFCHNVRLPDPSPCVEEDEANEWRTKFAVFYKDQFSSSHSNNTFLRPLSGEPLLPLKEEPPRSGGSHRFRATSLTATPPLHSRGVSSTSDTARGSRTSDSARGYRMPPTSLFLEWKRMESGKEFVTELESPRKVVCRIMRDFCIVCFSLVVVEVKRKLQSAPFAFPPLRSVGGIQRCILELKDSGFFDASLYLESVLDAACQLEGDFAPLTPQEICQMLFPKRSTPIGSAGRGGGGLLSTERMSGGQRSFPAFSAGTSTANSPRSDFFLDQSKGESGGIWVAARDSSSFFSEPPPPANRSERLDLVWMQQFFRDDVEFGAASFTSAFHPPASTPENAEACIDPSPFGATAPVQMHSIKKHLRLLRMRLRFSERLCLQWSAYDRYNSRVVAAYTDRRLADNGSRRNPSGLSRSMSRTLSTSFKSMVKQPTKALSLIFSPSKSPSNNAAEEE